MFPRKWTHPLIWPLPRATLGIAHSGMKSFFPSDWQHYGTSWLSQVTLILWFYTCCESSFHASSTPSSTPVSATWSVGALCKIQMQVPTLVGKSVSQSSGPPSQPASECSGWVGDIEEYITICHLSPGPMKRVPWQLYSASRKTRGSE
jgi:hypothetical protein